MIKFENVTFRYTDQDEPVLKNLDLTIQAGESVCVMGANGSGKSTFAKIVAGLLEVNQGSVRINHDSDHPMPVGILFQNPDNQMVAVTVEKEVAFALENLGVPLEEMEDRLTGTLERFRITHLRHRLTAELSGGEKQRVALASVMVFRPPILVLDEPDSFLDEGGKAALRKEIARIKEENPDLVEIRITQYPGVARSYRRLIVFDHGEVAADSDPAEIFADRDFCTETALAFSLESTRRFPVPSHLENMQSPRMTSVKRILASKVCFGYGAGHEIIKDLDFSLSAGDIIGLVGPSGSGKSTLGHLLCGLLEPTSGEIKYLDTNGRSVSREKVPGRVSGLFQQPERQFFLPECSEEIAFGPKNLGRELSKESVASFFAMVGLDAARFSARDPFTLSGGEKRRLAFAAVLSMSPSLVVFDEPTCGLDQEGVGRFILLGQALREMDVGLVIITHDADIIHALADRLIYLKGDGSHVELPKTEFFASEQYASVISPLTFR